MVPEVTVVIPTRDRPGGLAAALDALRGQTLPPDRFEAIVVDDGSSPPATAEAGGLRLRVLRRERSRGPAAARNTGWRAANAPLVAFTDDDCTPTAGWLAALLAEAGGGGERVVIEGPIAPRPDQRAALGPLSRTVEASGPNRLFFTANVAYPRALLEALGGFDEWFRHACGEDVELGARATKAGAELRFAAGALVHHEVRQPTLPQQLRQAWRWGDAVRVLKLHPEWRSELTARVFWRPSHAWLLLALAGLAGRRPLLATPYAVDVVRRGALPAHVAVDVAELASMALASARHRTLML